MPDKLKERVKFCNTFEEIDSIDKSSLPKECGGEVSLSDMISKLLFFITIFKLFFN